MPQAGQTGKAAAQSRQPAAQTFARGPERKPTPVAGGSQGELLNLQRAAGNRAVSQLVGAGEPLDAQTRAFMEERFQHDFSAVRVHTGLLAVRSARILEARAYAAGHDVVFDLGAYEPETPEGRQLLAHELTHVVQQSRGGSAPDPWDSASAIELDADLAAGAALRSNDAITVSGASGIGIAREDKDTKPSVPPPPRPPAAEPLPPAVQAVSGAGDSLSQLTELMNATVNEMVSYMKGQSMNIWQVAVCDLVVGGKRYVAMGVFDGKAHAEANALKNLAAKIPAPQWAGARIRMVVSKENCEHCQGDLHEAAKKYNVVIETFVPILPRKLAPPTEVQALHEPDIGKSAVERAVRDNKLDKVTLTTDREYLPEWHRGEAEGVPRGRDAAERPERGPGEEYVVHDLGDGLYFTDIIEVAGAYAEMRAPDDPGRRRVLSGHVDPHSLGRVLDLTKEPDFMKFFELVKQSLGKVPPKQYRPLVDAFLKKKGLKIGEFDVIIGPEGVRGGRQMCVRSPDAQNKVKAAMKVRSSGESGQPRPASPPEAPVAATPEGQAAKSEAKSEVQSAAVPTPSSPQPKPAARPRPAVQPEPSAHEGEEAKVAAEPGAESKTGATAQEPARKSEPSQKSPPPEPEAAAKPEAPAGALEVKSEAKIEAPAPKPQAAPEAPAARPKAEAPPKAAELQSGLPAGVKIQDHPPVSPKETQGMVSIEASLQHQAGRAESAAQGSVWILEGINWALGKVVAAQNKEKLDKAWKAEAPKMQQFLEKGQGIVVHVIYTQPEVPEDSAVVPPRVFSGLEWHPGPRNQPPPDLLYAGGETASVDKTYIAPPREAARQVTREAIETRLADLWARQKDDQTLGQRWAREGRLGRYLRGHAGDHLDLAPVYAARAELTSARIAFKQNRLPDAAASLDAAEKFLDQMSQNFDEFQLGPQPKEPEPTPEEKERAGKRKKQEDEERRLSDRLQQLTAGPQTRQAPQAKEQASLAAHAPLQPQPTSLSPGPMAQQLPGPFQGPNGKEPVKEAAQWVSGADAQARLLLINGRALEKRVNSDNPPTKEERQNFVRDEAIWRTIVLRQMNYYEKESRGEAYGELKALLNDPSRRGPKLDEVRTHLDY